MNAWKLFHFTRRNRDKLVTRVSKRNRYPQVEINFQWKQNFCQSQHKNVHFNCSNSWMCLPESILLHTFCARLAKRQQLVAWEGLLVTIMAREFSHIQRAHPQQRVCAYRATLDTSYLAWAITTSLSILSGYMCVQYNETHTKSLEEFSIRVIRELWVC